MVVGERVKQVCLVVFGSDPLLAFLGLRESQLCVLEALVYNNLIELLLALEQQLLDDS